jgi:hypothetical protein
LADPSSAPTICTKGGKKRAFPPLDVRRNTLAKQGPITLKYWAHEICALKKMPHSGAKIDFPSIKPSLMTTNKTGNQPNCGTCNP